MNTSIKFYVTSNGPFLNIIDSKTGRVVSQAHMIAEPEKCERLEAVCKKLNLRDYRQNRQFGESRADFAKRRAA